MLIVIFQKSYFNWTVLQLGKFLPIDMNRNRHHNLAGVSTSTSSAPRSNPSLGQSEISIYCVNQSEVRIYCDNQSEVRIYCDNQSEVSIYCDTQSEISITLTRFHLALRFWNQIFTWTSDSLKLWAIWDRSDRLRYFLLWNSFSNSNSCSLVNAVLLLNIK